MASTAADPSQSRVAPYRAFIIAGLLLIYVILTLAAAMVVYVRVRDEVSRSSILPSFTGRQGGAEQASKNVERVEGNPLPVWTGTARVTVLVLGIDERAQEEDYWRTDTMILGTLDPVTREAAMLSIPRDLWVTIPGYTENRINTAHALGDAYGHPGGGPALAVETVENFLGVDIDYYVRINFQAFIDLVDLIGGIDIVAPEAIDDDCYPTPDYGCEHYHLEAGSYHFYGQEALKYARVRSTAGGDFDRARRQQQVIRAVIDRVRSIGLPQLAARSPEILELVANSTKIDPNLQLDEMIALANLAMEIASRENSITYHVIDESCTLFKTTPDQMQILIPLRDRIRDVRDEVFGLALAKGDLDTVEEEAATISVLNGTQTAGLAYATYEYLQANGITVTVYDNADRQDYDTSVVILNRDKPLTAARILETLGLPKSALVNGANPTAVHDIVIILGADYVPPESAPSP